MTSSPHDHRSRSGADALPEAAPDNGPALTREEFDALFDTVRAWGRWSPAAAGRGAWNGVTPEHSRRAAALVRTGTTVAMALAWNTVAGPDNGRPALHYMSDLGDVEAPEPSCHKDFIAADYHGKGISHLDALSHIAYRGRLYDGSPAREVVDAAGARFGSVAALGPLATRGVLLDMPAVLDTEWLEPGTAVHAADVLAAEKALGVAIGDGDAVLLRSGRFRRRAELGAWNPDAVSAGFHVDAMPLLSDPGGRSARRRRRQRRTALARRRAALPRTRPGHHRDGRPAAGQPRPRSALRCLRRGGPP